MSENPSFEFAYNLKTQLYIVLYQEKHERALHKSFYMQIYIENNALRKHFFLKCKQFWVILN